MLFKLTICFFFFTEGLLALALVPDLKQDASSVLLSARPVSSNSYISVSQLKDLKAKNSEVIAKLQLIGTILDSYISKKENYKETLDEKINLEELIKENLNDILEGKTNLQELLGIHVQEQDKDFRNELKQHWQTLTSLWNEFSKMSWLLISYVLESEISLPIRHPLFSTRFPDEYAAANLDTFPTRFPHPFPTRFPQPIPTDIPRPCFKKRDTLNTLDNLKYPC